MTGPELRAMIRRDLCGEDHENVVTPSVVKRRAGIMLAVAGAGLVALVIWG